MHDGPSPDVVVVGGGVIGLAAAWRLSAAGRHVVVVDPSPGRGATWAAAGMLAPVGEANFGEAELSALLVRGSKAWPTFVRALEDASGVEVGYRTDGTLLVAVDPSDRAALAELLDFRRSLGLDSERLSAAACRSAEPLLSPAIRGGADLCGDHQVDNRLLVRALLAALERVGVTVVPRRATAVIAQGDRVGGVELDDGVRLASPSVVIAAGCWSGQLEGLPDGARPPVRPVKGLTLRLAAGPHSHTPSRTVRGLVHGRSCYLVPRRDGTLVVGATVEERGFDLAVEVRGVGDLLDDARRLLPSIEDFELLETSTGLRPGSPDNAPLVGTSGLRGLIVATGHYRNGVLLAPVTAEEVLHLVEAEGRPDVRDAGGVSSPFRAFRPARFAGSSEIGGATSAAAPATPRRPAPTR